MIEGDREITLPAPLDVLPLLIRENHLIPLLDPSIDTLSDREATAGVIRPTDVADVYDVVGLVTSRAQFKLFDGDQFDVVVSGTVAPPALPEASSEQELSTCSGCFLLDTLPDGGQRLRVSSESPTIAAGGVQLSATTDRRIRWDIYLCPDC